jgi:chitinase
VTLTASASDLGSGSGAPSGVADVTFNLNGTKISSDSTAPYSISWSIKKNQAPGQYTLTAVATDVAGNATTSAPITVTITA